MRVLWKILQRMDKIEKTLSQIVARFGAQEGNYATNDVQWIDSQEVMDFLNISRSTFYRLKKEGSIISRKVGKRSYYFKSDLLKAFAASIRKGRL